MSQQGADYADPRTQNLARSSPQMYGSIPYKPARQQIPVASPFIPSENRPSKLNHIKEGSSVATPAHISVNSLPAAVIAPGEVDLLDAFSERRVHDAEAYASDVAQNAAVSTTGHIHATAQCKIQLQPSASTSEEDTLRCQSMAEIVDASALQAREALTPRQLQRTAHLEDLLRINIPVRHELNTSSARSAKPLVAQATHTRESTHSVASMRLREMTSHGRAVSSAYARAGGPAPLEHMPHNQDSVHPQLEALSPPAPDPIQTQQDASKQSTRSGILDMMHALAAQHRVLDNRFVLMGRALHVGGQGCVHLAVDRNIKHQRMAVKTFFCHEDFWTEAALYLNDDVILANILPHCNIGLGAWVQVCSDCCIVTEHWWKHIDQAIDLCLALCGHCHVLYGPVTDA